MNAAFVTGPHALLFGYGNFRRDVGVSVPRTIPGNKCVKAGDYTGTDGRNITVVGIGENEKEFVIREAIPRFKKMKEYETMGMKHFTTQTQQANGKSCLAAIREEQRRE